MKKKTPEEMTMDQIGQLLNEIVRPLIAYGSKPKSRMSDPDPIVVVSVARFRPQEPDCTDLDFCDILETLQEAEEARDYDPDDENCDDWDEEDDCEDYEPISENNDRCLFLCPGCGTCMKKHLEEDMV